MQRNLQIDELKIVMAAMVVGLHASLFQETSHTLSHILVDGLFRMAVPVFFVLNGYYLGASLHRDAKMRGWFTRLLSLYCFWMLVYLPLFWREGPHGGLAQARYLAWTMLLGYHHLWYISAMVGAAVLLLLLRRQPPWVMATAAAGLFLAGCLVQYVSYYTGHALPTWAYRNAVFVGFPMMVAGYLLRIGYIPRLRADLLTNALLLGAAGLLCESIASMYGPRPGRGFDLYLSLAILCPALVTLALRSKHFGSSDRAAKLSEHIYFIHPLFMALWYSEAHVPRGTILFILTLILCLVTFYPVYRLSKRFTFIL